MPMSRSRKREKLPGLPQRAALLIVIGLLLLISGCDVNHVRPYREQLVLEGQMIVGYTPVVRISHTVPIDRTDIAVDNGISGARVTLRIGGDSSGIIVPMTEMSDQAGHGYWGPGHYGAIGYAVLPGVRYAITAVVNGDTLTAETVAAGSLHIASQNQDTVICGRTNLVLRWYSDPYASGYYVVIDNMELRSNRHDADCNVIPFGTFAPGDWTVSHRDDSLSVPWVMLRYAGPYQAIVYSCDHAFWDYAYTSTYGQVENYPVSNVHGGLGVFCALGVDTTYFYLENQHDSGEH